jgi:hypothetical protein
MSMRPRIVPQGLLHRLVGYVCHELGHYWFTASRVWDKAAGGDKFLHGLINGLEDPRIEKKVIRSNFAGNSRNLFEGLVNHVVGAELPTDFDNIPFLLAVEGRRLNGYDILAKQTYQTTPWAADLEWALTEAHTAPDTKRITEIAIELAKRLREKPKGGEQGGEQWQGGEQASGEQGQSRASPVMNPVRASPVSKVSNPVRARSSSRARAGRLIQQTGSVMNWPSTRPRPSRKALSQRLQNQPFTTLTREKP